MPIPSNSYAPRARIHLLVMASGLASLSWEVLWQIKSSLALGVSAWGTALTLAATMGGMSIGALTMGHALKKRPFARPARLYAALEVIVGISGLFLNVGFRAVEALDTEIYATAPDAAPLVHVLGIVLCVGIPTVCMGATLPVFGLVAGQFRSSIATLYGLNTLGAASGSLIAAFLLIPLFGVTHTIWIIAAVNVAVGIYAWMLEPGENVSIEQREESSSPSRIDPTIETLLVVVTGYATFTLEVAWFRSLTAAFKSNTAAFAIMLSCVLLSLGVAARLVPLLKRKNVSLGTVASWAGILILLATPLIERFDLALPIHTRPVFIIFNWFLMTLYVIGAPVTLLGMAVPWILDDQKSPRRWGTLYALNTLAAIVGSISAAWIFLPTIGFARTAWIAGSIVALAGIIAAPRRARITGMVGGIIALFIAVHFESGVGRTRAQGQSLDDWGKMTGILEFYEGPASTISVAAYDNGGRLLVIDGSPATGQSGKNVLQREHYMPWMGHLPMLLHTDPKNALVICFGTGQTANAVRNENPQSLDIVDINAQIFKLAPYFPSNQHVLDDPRVKTIVMDGRAYMRRNTKTYDVITLEPMPPVLAGVNALYSKEFYELARAHLGPGGMIAQWLPFHTVAPHYSASIAKTFQSVFPNAILWNDPVSDVGILLGTTDDNGAPLGTNWPGFARTPITRDISEDGVRNAILLDSKGLRRYGAYGKEITDDNQLLAYGEAIYAALPSPARATLRQDNLDLIEKVKQGN